jgi:NADPH:quinone reductase-like Zn-dependent oxidoreductase
MAVTTHLASYAVRVHEHGGLDVLRYEAVDCGEPSAGEVRVRVVAAGVNPIDAAIRQGFLKRPVPLPAIPGGDVSGFVDAVGPGVTDFSVGDPVYGVIGRTGAYAQYVVAPAAVFAPKPATLDHVHAAAVPLAALTAWQMIFELAQLRQGQRVLVHAAAGGVGGFAVQMAKQVGATVLGTAGEENESYVRELGADHVIDYRASRFEDVARDMDLVLDLVGGETQHRSWSVLKRGGKLVTACDQPLAEHAHMAGAHALRVSVRPDGGQLSKIGELIDAGRLRVHVSETFPLTEAARAHACIQTRHTRGKLVLRVSE